MAMIFSLSLCIIENHCHQFLLKMIKKFYKNGKLKYLCTHYYDGKIAAEYYYNNKGEIHRGYNKPAVSIYFDNGFALYFGFRINGLLCNFNNPITISFSPYGKIHDKDYCYFNVCSRINWVNQIKKI